MLIAYVLAYLPFFRVTRILFLYHYLTPLVFALACVLIWLDEAGWTRPDNAGRQEMHYFYGQYSTNNTHQFYCNRLTSLFG